MFVLPYTTDGFPLLSHLGTYQDLYEKMDLIPAGGKLKHHVEIRTFNSVFSSISN